MYVSTQNNHCFDLNSIRDFSNENLFKFQSVQVTWFFNDVLPHALKPVRTKTLLNSVTEDVFQDVVVQAVYLYFIKEGLYSNIKSF